MFLIHESPPWHTKWPDGSLLHQLPSPQSQHGGQHPAPGLANKVISHKLCLHTSASALQRVQMSGFNQGRSGRNRLDHTNIGLHTNPTRWISRPVCGGRITRPLADKAVLNWQKPRRTSPGPRQVSRKWPFDREMMGRDTVTSTVGPNSHQDAR